MKWLFFVLLVANLAIFAVARLLPPAVTASNPANREINASAIQIVSEGHVPAASTPSSDADATTQDNAATSQAASGSSATNAGSEGKLCLRWHGLVGEQIAAARQDLAALSLNAQEKGSSGNNRVWVYIPPLDTMEQAKAKAEQLKGLGVDDYFIVNDGRRWQNAISLGIYSTREAGERALEEFRAKGVKSAVLRDRDDTLRRTDFLIRSATTEQYNALKRASTRYRGAELQELASCN
ncbi:SPOR domain-containing protein [Chitinilyticum piscinae]|uniref:SPOR domain-containing protein n=1 Tax=Chitinilyticum piscinae TaxID=2866724 RepID=A0A8J7K1F5_9NEIS|nr:SPOR domain-containing protein [Chitinilyticum piscinae]MBE9608617.1 SPOR domain-containing protein [Chitinilyticum piscinae]